MPLGHRRDESCCISMVPDEAVGPADDYYVPAL
jgi:hypothetical protein